MEGESVRAEPTVEKSEPRSGPIPSLREYIKDVRVEMTKVSWPTREELRQHTMVVIVMVIIVAIFTGAVDRALSFAFEALLKLLG
jgi:preprotein translocase subunit SecE